MGTYRHVFPARIPPIVSDPALQTSPSDDARHRAAKVAALRPVYDLVKEQFQAVNALIPTQLTSDVDLVIEIGEHIVSSGGKRLRPLMVLLTTGALGYKGECHTHLAATIEFLHTATLLHDDVVDHSDMRRGRVTANEKWGNAPSVLVGDFLYSRAFQMMIDIGDMQIMAILAQATNTIAEGEVLQLANIGNTNTSEIEYREIIRCKTAMLFEAATHTGAVLACSGKHTADDTVDALRRFGLHFGITYQLVDDWLDYVGDATTMGKRAGDDLAEGKLTLPLIYALTHSSPHDCAIIQEAITNQSADAQPAILDIVTGSGALDYTRAAVHKEAEKAIACLDQIPPGPYVDALHTLTEFSTDRLF